MPRNAIAAFLTALGVALVTWLLLPRIPEVGGFLTLIGWVVVGLLILYGIYLAWVGRRGTPTRL